jgi:PAS domain S-box-containing protein
MGTLKKHLGKHSDQAFALLILISVATISYFIPYKLVFLDFFFIVVFLGAYYLNAHEAVLGGVLTTLLVIICVYYFPRPFMPTFTELDLWMNIMTWAGFLILTAGVVGKLTHRLKTEMGELKETNISLESEKEKFATSADREFTVRKRLEEKLHQTEERYRDLFDKAPDMMAVIKPDGKILECNQTLADAIGCSKENIEGSSWLDLYHPESRAIAKETFDSFAETGHIAWKERGILRADGSVMPVLIHSRRIRDERGSLVATEVTWRDITEHKQLQEQLLQSQKMEVVGKLAGGVAHDFNNILTGISGYSQLLLQHVESNSPARQDLLEINALADRAAGITRQLLAFSRKQAPKSVVLNLNSTFENSTKMLERLKLRFLPASDLGNVRADPSQIEQVLMNLAVNARDAMPNGGILSIKTANVDFDQTYAQEHLGSQAGSFVTLAVTDTGCGMDRATQERIFEPFFTTKQKGRGTGLGLSMVYGIVQQHEGHIRVETKPGEGTTFRIFFPRVEEKTTETTATATQEVSAEGSETILVAEDERVIGEVIERSLEGLGYRVFITDGAEEAEKVFSRHSDKIDLLLADVVMPGLKGPELYERLAAKLPSLKVLYMSGYSDVAVVDTDALEQRGSFIQKPFTANSLAVKVREVLGREEQESGRQVTTEIPG